MAVLVVPPLFRRDGRLDLTPPALCEYLVRGRTADTPLPGNGGVAGAVYFAGGGSGRNSQIQNGGSISPRVATTCVRRGG